MDVAILDIYVSHCCYGYAVGDIFFQYVAANSRKPSYSLHMQNCEYNI